MRNPFRKPTTFLLAPLVAAVAVELRALGIDPDYATAEDVDRVMLAAIGRMNATLRAEAPAPPVPSDG